MKVLRPGDRVTEPIEEIVVVPVSVTELRSQQFGLMLLNWLRTQVLTKIRPDWDVAVNVQITGSEQVRRPEEMRNL